MIHIRGAAMLAILCAAAAAEVPPLAAQSGVTIYNDGRVLVRRSFPLRVPAGASTQAVGVGTADPATLFSLDPDVTIEGATYDAAVDEQSVLRRSVGKRLIFRTGTGYRDGVVVADTVSALVLGVDPLRLRMPDGRVMFTMPGQPQYPAELVLAEPAMSVRVESRGAKEVLGLGYFSSGAAWQAAYAIVLEGRGSQDGRDGQGTARVTGQAVLASEALRLEDAEVQLLAGSVSRAAPPVLQDAMAREGRMMAEVGNASAKMAEQRVGEFHLYSLPGRHSLLPGQTTTVALFDPASTASERNYVVRGQIPFWGYLPQQPEEGEVPVEVSYTLKRPRKTDFGDRPLPGGIARLYQADSAGRLQLVGEASMDHTPAGEDLRLSAGTAFDLTAKRIQTTYTTRRDSVGANRWRTLADAGYRVTITNATDSAATVDVIEQRGGEWRVLTSSVPGEKVSATLTRFRVAVPARGETVLTYRVRVVW
jgi:hypothetical protein